MSRRRSDPREVTVDALANEEGSMHELVVSRIAKEITKSRRVALLLWPGCDVLDVCGPADVFFYAQYWQLRHGKTDLPGYQWDIVAATPGPIRTTCGIEIVATHGYADLEDGLDTLLVVGGAEAEQASKDPALVDCVRSLASRARRVGSICTGTFILAAAGLLHQRRVTTHWLYSEILARAYPSIDVDSSLIYYRDGNIYTSGGITAGIDLSLALVEEDLGREIALATARTLVVFPRRPGGQSQFSAFATYMDVGIRPDIQELRSWILGHPGEDLSVSALADRMGMSPRNFARLFHSETGDTPALFAERARADAARCKLEQTVLPVEVIAKQCGFGNAERMRRTFQRLFDVSPHDYRARFRSTLLN
ncbi:GlxA family transcriptional regulator [Methylocapsa sp. D3K7]|uniref:GlxA family transcriptional regulator n=1 Tax=Methylocapsa sp. D3K7 TaxID=3041435 RepID=UPI00244EB9CA|nr:GlxA family transcriptional regulator [Methylocapsa sp. D3K7]WGJ15564.1 GlxA family transcriptional regulator [Methylocapsa sp. D3K7]